MRAAGGRVLSQRGVVAAAVASLLLAGGGGRSSVSSAQTAKAAPPQIGRIQRPFNNDVCGCTLIQAARRRSEVDDAQDRTVFASADAGGRGQMNIDGRDVMLRLIRRRSPRGALKVGQRSVEEYEGGGARVIINTTITEVCPPGDETCEIVSFSAVLTVTKGGRTRTVKASGQCSC